MILKDQREKAKQKTWHGAKIFNVTFWTVLQKILFWYILKFMKINEGFRARLEWFKDEDILKLQKKKQIWWVTFIKFIVGLYLKSATIWKWFWGFVTMPSNILGVVVIMTNPKSKVLLKLINGHFHLYLSISNL